MKVVIIGGSVSGLMHGVMLRHNGHDVHILERVPRNLEAQGAGVTTANEVAGFLAKHDRIKSPLSVYSNGMRVFDPSSKNTGFHGVPMQMSSWDAMYYRLRANFDRLATSYCPAPLPPDLPTDGSEIVYDIGKEVTAIEHSGPGGPITIRYRDRLEGGAGENDAGKAAPAINTLTADIVIGADGATSTIRSLVAPRAPPRRYAGYVAWRGIAPEGSVTKATLDLLISSATLHTASGEYAIVYPIPGKDGALEKGQLGLNFVWYSWQNEEQLADILTDSDGHKHRWSVPSGKLRAEVWERQKQHGIEVFSKEFGEVISNTQTPFIQAISDCASPSNPGPSFFDGRVLLVGDAQCVIRPHTGFALNQAARHCRELEARLPQIEANLQARREGKVGDSVPGNDCMATWNETVLDFGHIVRLRSIAFGLLYMKTRLRWVPSALHLKWAEFWLATKEKWRRWRQRNSNHG